MTKARIEAIDQIETWNRDFALDADFQRIPAYLYSESNKGSKDLEEECEALERLGLSVSQVSTAPLPFGNSGGCKIENQARFHSLKYLQGLAANISSEDCAIYEHTPARPPEDGEPCTVEIQGEKKLKANVVLVCTHSAFLGLSQFDLRVAPYQSYILTVRVEDDLPDALFWDDAQPAYHYTRRASTGEPDLLIIGGSDHKTGQGNDERDAFHQLEQYIRQRFSVRKVEQQWSAEFFEPADGLPYIGRVPMKKHVYLSTGYAGTGLTFGTMAGRLLADLVLDQPSPLADIFSPSRLKPLAAGSALVKENLNATKHFVVDRFTGESIKSLEEVPPGKGRLVKYNGKQWAIYRDESNAVHVLSPICTHMGCHVQWNEAEKTWDCPCHGGRYSALGERLYGPPAKDLDQQPLDEL